MKTSSLFSRLPLHEQLNVATHGIGLLLSIVGIPILFWLGNYSFQSGIELIGVSMFLLGLVLVYTASTGYHLLKGSVKHKWRVFDHISIYLLIGGTYTAYVLKYLEPSIAIRFLLAQWAIIIAGICFKLFFTGKYDLLSTLLYLFLGLMAIFIEQPLRESMPSDVKVWVVAGGISYIVGVGFYLMEKYQFSHPIWHLFVLAGSAFHYIGLCCV